MATRTRRYRKSRKFWRSIGKRRVGRVYHRKGAWAKIIGSRVRRKAGSRRRNRAVRWSGKRGKVVYVAISGRRGKKGFRKVKFTNPRRHRRSRSRRNPAAVGRYIGGLTSAPKQALGLFKGKGMIGNVATTAGGALAAYFAGSYATKFLSPYLAMIPGAAPLLAKPMVQRVVGGLMPYTVAFIGSRFLPAKWRGAVHLGGAIASIVEILAPDMISGLIAKVSSQAPAPIQAAVATVAPAAGPVSGLAGYFGTDYGMAGYVSDSAYRAVGEPTAMAGYVADSSYRGTGEQTALAGYVSDSAYRAVGSPQQLAAYIDDSYLTNDYLK